MGLDRPLLEVKFRVTLLFFAFITCLKPNFQGYTRRSHEHMEDALPVTTIPAKVAAGVPALWWRCFGAGKQHVYDSPLTSPRRSWVMGVTCHEVGPLRTPTEGEGRGMGGGGTAGYTPTGETRLAGGQPRWPRLNIWPR